MKDRLKNLFSKTWIKVISFITIFLLGIFMLGKCNKVAAANFTLSDGSTSKVTYNEGQSLYYSSGTGFGATNNYLQISSSFSNYNIVINSVGSATFTIHNKCTKSNDVITCTNYNSISVTGTTATNYTRTYTFTIGYDYVDVYIELSNATNRYTISSYNQTDLDNSYQSGYNTGFTEGQNSVDITTDNQSYADNYIRDNNYHTNTDYINYGNTKYQEGYNDRDITTDNQTAIDNYIINNNYHSNSEYLEYGETKYQEGYNDRDITTDNQTAINNYIADNNYHSNSEYLEYGESKYNEGLTDNQESIYNNGYTAGQNSVDITIDNQAAIDNYIADNNYHSNSEYLEYGETKYNEGYNDRDITTDNQTAIDNYIADNNYHSNSEYLEYGESKYNEGYNKSSSDIWSTAVRKFSSYQKEGDIEIVNACTNVEGLTNCVSAVEEYISDTYKLGQQHVDITTDNQSYADSYIADNNYHTNQEYINYGKLQYQYGYDEAIKYAINELYDKAVYEYEYVWESDSMLKPGYGCGTNEECKITYDNWLNTLDNTINDYSHNLGFIEGQNSVDITTDNQSYADSYIADNNYHTNQEYLEYGESKYNNGYEEGHISGLAVKRDFYIINPYDEDNESIKYEKWTRGMMDAYDCYKLNGVVDDSYIEVTDFDSYLEGFNTIKTLTNSYNIDISGLENHMKGIGYRQGMDDKGGLMALIPGTLGAIVSNAMPILTYEVYGISIMNIIGLIALVGVAIIVVKFAIGG